MKKTYYSKLPWIMIKKITIWLNDRALKVFSTIVIGTFARTENMVPNPYSLDLDL